METLNDFKFGEAIHFNSRNIALVPHREIERGTELSWGTRSRTRLRLKVIDCGPNLKELLIF
jgi:hypothetical protein